MTVKTLFLLICLCSYIRVSAQDTARVIDKVYTSDHKVYTGQITDDKKGDYLTIDVYNKGSFVIDYKTIIKIQYHQENDNNTAPDAPAQPANTYIAHKDTSYNLDLVAFNGYRATPRVTDKLIRKRNTGIGLTVGGVCLIGLGALAYAVSPKQGGASSGGYVTLPSAGSIAGILMIVCGAGIAIPGAIIWGSYTRRIHKAERGE
jgi:hypothetical protein